MLDIFGWVIVAATALMSLAFIVETALGLLPAPGRVLEAAAEPRIVFVVPAHNEEGILAATLERLKAEITSSTGILVVADNCSDSTAEIARGAEVEAIERNEPELRGKGYALAFAREHLRSDPPDVVIVFDADCTIDRRSIAQLAAVAAARQRPAQASYLFVPRPDTPPMVQISNFAFMVKNLVRQRGAARLGAAAILTGTGMAFPWSLFATAEFSGGSVEDLDLGVELVARNAAPVFVPEATVLSAPAGASAAVMQRDRWERGFVSTARRTAVPLLWRGIRTGNGAMLWLGLHLLTPPLALLVLVGLGGAALLTLLQLLGMDAAPLLAQAGLLAAIGLLVAVAWVRGGRAYVSAGTLMRIPLYLLWKLPIYLRLLRGAERSWNRTDRTTD